MKSHLLSVNKSRDLLSNTPPNTAFNTSLIASKKNSPKPPKKGKYNICVYAISKNERAFTERWMSSMSEADAVFVTDTGSDDGTPQSLKALGAKVFFAKVQPWRFDEARNISLQNVPEDFDICLCTDLDEWLKPGWRALIEAHWQEGVTTMGRYLYNWSVKPDGTPDVQFYYTKLHARKGYRWQYPVHECLLPQGRHIVTHIPGMELTHYPDTTKPRGSYLGLLELAVKEQPQDDRMSYYLAREYKYKDRWQECIDEVKRYLKLPTALWAQERSAAMCLAGHCCDKLGDYAGCKQWFFRAAAQAPDRREPYVELAQAAYQRSDWQTCFTMAEQALAITKRQFEYVTQGYAWDYTPYDLSAVAAYYLGLYSISALRAGQALELAPYIYRLQNNLDLIQKKLPNDTQ